MAARGDDTELSAAEWAKIEKSVALAALHAARMQYKAQNAKQKSQKKQAHLSNIYSRAYPNSHALQVQQKKLSQQTVDLGGDKPSGRQVCEKKRFA
jgi:hypothetical protein